VAFLKAFNAAYATPSCEILEEIDDELRPRGTEVRSVTSDAPHGTYPDGKIDSNLTCGGREEVAAQQPNAPRPINPETAGVYSPAMAIELLKTAAPYSRIANEPDPRVPSDSLNPTGPQGLSYNGRQLLDHARLCWPRKWAARFDSILKQQTFLP